MAPILGIWASQNYSRYSITGSYESIATVTVGSGGSSYIEFTSIPGTYTHLQIRGILRNTGSSSSQGKLQLNADTGTNYSWHRLYGDGSSATAYGEGNSTTLGEFIMPNSATVFGAFVTDILDYANTNKYKTGRTLIGNDQNGSGSIILLSGSWRNTNAVTSIKISANADNFAQYSHFALYGIKGA